MQYSFYVDGVKKKPHVGEDMRRLNNSTQAITVLFLISQSLSQWGKKLGIK